MIGNIKTLCDHCGNVSYKRLLCKDEVREGEDFIEHRLYRCTICHGIILLKEIDRLSEDELRSEQELEPVRTEQVWPAPLSLSSEVPDRVREIYEEARTVRSSPSSFVVQIRRALEAMAKDKKANGRVLNDKLNWLIAQELLPPVFGKMSHISKMLGNWGAHDADSDVQPEDVEVVDEFFRAIVEYLYVAPAKVGRVEGLIEARKNAV